MFRSGRRGESDYLGGSWMEAPETLATIDEQPSITFVARSLSNFARFFYIRFRSVCNSSELSIIWLKTHQRCFN